MVACLIFIVFIAAGAPLVYNQKPHLEAEAEKVAAKVRADAEQAAADAKAEANKVAADAKSIVHVK